MQFIKFKDYKMPYQVFGHGHKTLFAFHGFGRNAHDFKLLEPSLGNSYKIVSFDLFYHGSSDAPTLNTFNYTPKDLKEMIIQYLHKQNLERFSLLAYSLGGRISLQIIELFPDQIDRVFLFAPDGLKYTWWYNLSTKTIIGNKLFKRFVKSPDIYFLIFKSLNKVGILKNSVFKFLNLQLDSQSKRQKVYDTHLFYRNIHPDLEKIQAILNTKPIKLYLFFGRHDAIIPSSYGRKFLKGLNDKTSLHVLESDHLLIKESVNAVLTRIIEKS